VNILGCGVDAVPKQEEIIEPLPVKRLVVIGGVLAAIILIVVIVTSTSAGKPSVDSLGGKVETTTVSAIQATANVYYVKKGYYPASYEEMIESDPKYAEDLKGYRTKLKDFEYTRRGDSQAYQITYTNIAGEKIVVNGDYKNEYH
jgi:hypothetical protein